MLDTGSQITLIGRDVLEKLDDTRSNISSIRHINIMAANNKKIGTISKKFNIETTINNNTYFFTYFIYDNMNFSVIIGIDIISSWEMILDFEKNILKIGENTVEFIKYVDQDEEVLVNHVGIMVEEKDKIDLFNINTQEYHNETTDNILSDKNPYIQNINFNTNIKHETKHKLEKMLLENEIIYNDVVTFARDIEHKIELTSDEPFCAKQYAIPYKFNKQVQVEIEKLLSQGIIERSDCCFVNPIVLVQKQNGGLRMCLDARTLNQRICPRFENPQNINVLMGRCGNNNYFTKLDLKSAYWLIRLEQHSKQYCGFSINGNIYQFTVTPFGLRTSSSSLIKVLEKILRKHDAYCTFYFDDILVFSKTEEEHLVHVEQVLVALNEGGLKINIDKCEFFKHEVKFLGYVINNDGITMDPERLKEITNYPRPRRLKQLRSLLGFLNYYSKFVQNYTHKISPLLNLLKKGIKWKWTLEHENTFNELKQNFTDKLKLYHPIFHKPFIIRSDASEVALGAELVQEQDGIEVPIAFAARSLKNAEKKYSIVELEALAIIFACQRFRYYIQGVKFILYTDHITLTHLLDTRFQNNRIYRWSLLLNEFDFEIRYKPGKHMVVADILSRKYDRQKNNEVMIGNIILANEGIFSLDKIKEIQNNEEFKLLKDKLIREGTYKGYSFKQGVIIKKIGIKEVYVLDEAHTIEIVKKLHDYFIHMGIRKCYVTFREAFYCKHDQKIIKNVIRTCLKCQLCKERNYTQDAEIGHIIVNHPLQIVAIDFLCNLPRTREGYKHMLVLYDIFSKYIKLIPTKKADTENTLKGIHDFFEDVGNKADIILSDNGTAFTNDRYKEHLHQLGIKTYYTSIRRPSSNPCERAIKEIVKCLRILLFRNKHNHWNKEVAHIQEVINNSPNTVDGIAPVTILKGTPAYRPWWENEHSIQLAEIYNKVRQRFEKKQRKLEIKRQNKNKIYKKYAINDKVLVKALKVSNRKKHIQGKLCANLEGPYLIHRIYGSTYELIDIDSDLIKGKYHISQLYDFHEPVIKESI